MNSKFRTRTACLLSIADNLPMEGKMTGFVKIPYATDKSAYGFIPVPFVTIGRGEGPIALLIAGSHGDEYEGQLALARIARELDPKQVQGHVLIFPAANPPAVRAGCRNSPIDGYSLNRIYPGDVRGTPTAIIADYIERHLMSIADIVVDLHSGGQSLQYTPCATMMDFPDAAERSRRLALALAFGAPTVLVFRGYEERNSSGAAMRAGSVRIGAEIGGGASVDAALVEMAINGVMNVLRWSGLISCDSGGKGANVPSQLLMVDNQTDFVYALAHGVFEPRAKIGDGVSRGDLAGLLHDTLRPLEPPTEVRFHNTGTVVCARVPGLTEPGDCLFHSATRFIESEPGEVAQAARSTWVKSVYRKRRSSARRRSS